MVVCSSTSRFIVTKVDCSKLIFSPVEEEKTSRISLNRLAWSGQPWIKIRVSSAYWIIGQVRF
jgi:hypothetical protein